MPKTTTEDQIRKLEAKKEELDGEIKKRREQLKQRDLRKSRMEATKKRKLDTRRKILLGGLVMAHMDRDKAFAVQVRLLMHTLLQDRDKALFSDILPEAAHDPEPANERESV